MFIKYFNYIYYIFYRDSDRNVLDEGKIDCKRDYEIKDVVVFVKNILPQLRYHGIDIIKGHQDSSVQLSPQLVVQFNTDHGDGKCDSNGNSQRKCRLSPYGVVRDIGLISNTKDETISGTVTDFKRRVVKHNCKYSRVMYDLS